MRRALWGLALLAAAVSCGSATNGTSLFVTVAWDDSWPLVALKFSGTQDTTDAFPAAVLPDPPAAHLQGPQTIVILLKNSLGGQQVELSVQGLTADGGTFASAKDSVDVVLNTQEPVSINLVAGTGGGSAGGGSATGGGGSISAGGGAAGGSGPAGGGSAAGGGSVQNDGGMGGGVATSCSCMTGCCAAGLATCERAHGDYFTCGDAGTPCLGVCNGLTADRCGAAGACMCGTNAACNPGTRCAAVNGSGPSCICDTKSNCNGCCDGDNCRSGTLVTAGDCGVAGEVCDSCGNNSCVVGVCTGPAIACVEGLGCISGKSCEPLPVFPVCVLSANNHCLGCDPNKSNSCGVDICQCGEESACEGTDTTCALQKDGGYGCVMIAGGG